MPKVSAAHLEARRQQILDAALVCFDRSGFHRASMQDIFGESGLSAGAVYRYFASKEDIIEALAEQRHTAEAALLAEGLAIPDLRSALHHLTDRWLAWISDPDEQRRRRLGVQIWAEAVHNPRLRAIVQRGSDQRLLLAGRLQSAVLGPGLEAEPLTRVLLALLQGFLIQQAWQPDVDIDGYRRQVHALIDAAIPEPQPSSTPTKGARP